MIKFTCPWCATPNTIANDGDTTEHTLRSAPSAVLLALDAHRHPCTDCGKTIHFAIYVEAEAYLKREDCYHDSD